MQYRFRYETMQIGLFLAPGHNGEGTSDLIEYATLAEELGFDFLGFGDSQSIFKELYSSLGLVAHETESITIGPAVTNPVTRHPAVTASAISTVDEISGGRARLGIGTGDSGVYTLGKRPARLAELEESVNVMQSLMDGDSVEYEGEDIQLTWLQESGYTPDVPVYIAAEGPKTLELAGKIADGVYVGTGLSPELIRESIERVDAGARAAGKDPETVSKWILARANVGDDREKAVDEIKMELAASANHAFRFTLDEKHVPDEHKEAIRTLQEQYDPHDHESLNQDGHQDLVDDLGLTDFLADRFAIVGTADECVEQLRNLADVEGVDGVLLPAYAEEKRQFISSFGEDIIPRL